jgi:Mn2+/Fe2+ NRAMP family transporter
MSSPSEPAPPIPTSFVQYLRSFGPGLVVVLTWLGAGDIVDMSVAGGNYGYSLMWVLVLAVAMRFLFVSLIAKYQLCNQHGEGVLDGLVRLHSWYGPMLLAAAVVMGHVYGSYMTVGIGEACRNMTGIGTTWQWALLFNGLATALVFRPAFQRMETLFKLLMTILSVSFVGTAIWVGPNFAGIGHGLVSFEVPQQTGQFGPLLVAMAMIGAVGGSLMNLVYPYFLDAKGWRGPQYRRLQFYDFLLAIVVMILLNLSIWTLGAELLYPHGLTIAEMDDMPWLLSMVLGPTGRTLFYLGIFAAIYTSLIGHAIGLACMGSHAYLRMRAGVGSAAVDYRGCVLYRWIVVWCLVSPLIWTAPGMPDFVTLTLVVSGAQVLMLPLIAGGLWRITAAARYIGPEFRNRWWENAVMAVLFGLAIVGAAGSVQSLIEAANSSVVETTDASLITDLELLGAQIERNNDGKVVSLDLTGRTVADEQLKALKRLPQLRRLDLSDTDVTDIGLYHLKSIDSLETLSLQRTQVTRSGVETLRWSLPRCDIVH